MPNRLVAQEGVGGRLRRPANPLRFLPLKEKAVWIRPYFHLIVQPTGAVSATGAGFPASTASSA